MDVIESRAVFLKIGISEGKTWCQARIPCRVPSEVSLRNPRISMQLIDVHYLKKQRRSWYLAITARKIFFICFLLWFFHLFFIFSCWLPLFHFICLFVPFICFHFHACFLLNFLPSLYMLFDKRTGYIETFIVIFWHCLLYILVLRKQWREESKIQMV